MTRASPLARSGLTLAVLLGLALIFAGMRVVRANGVFSFPQSGFAGVCRTLPLAGVSDMEIDAADHLALLAVLDARHPGASDGIYWMDLEGTTKPVRLAGTPPDFHPRGISLYRTSNGGLFLTAINHRSTGTFSIDVFELTRKDGAWSLALQNTIAGGLLSDPQDVAMVAPGAFYLTNGVTAKNPLMRMLQTYGAIAGGDIVLFNGTVFREVVNGLPGPRGLALSPDGHLLVADATGRDLVSLTREDFTGNLSEAGRIDLSAGGDRLTVDSAGNVWAAGHANLFSWARSGRDPAARASSQIFKVSLSGGVPQSVQQVYGNDGSEIASASVGAAVGERLLIGSPLDGRFLDCEMR